MKQLCIGLLALTFFVAAPALAADASTKGKVLHVVAFKYKKAITDAKKKEVADSFKALKTKIPEIISIQHGPNISKEGFDKGFHECFIVTFASEKDRDTYLKHAEHEKFAKSLDSILADKGVFVFDFVAKE